MTHGTIAGLLIPALIDGRDHPWQAAYDPARKPIGTAATFISETTVRSSARPAVSCTDRRCMPCRQSLTSTGRRIRTWIPKTADA